MHAFGIGEATRGLPRLRVNRHLSFDGFGSKFAEGLLDVDVILGTRLEEQHVSVLLAELARLNCRHFALLFQVDFVTNDQERECVNILGLRLRQKDLLPVEQVVKTRWISDIVYQTAAVCTSVEG